MLLWLHRALDKCDVDPHHSPFESCAGRGAPGPFAFAPVSLEGGVIYRENDRITVAGPILEDQATFATGHRLRSVSVL